MVDLYVLYVYVVACMRARVYACVCSCMCDCASASVPAQLASIAYPCMEVIAGCVWRWYLVYGVLQVCKICHCERDIITIMKSWKSNYP